MFLYVTGSVSAMQCYCRQEVDRASGLEGPDEDAGVSVVTQRQRGRAHRGQTEQDRLRV